MTHQGEQGMDALPPPAGIPDTATRDWVPLTRNETLELLTVPLDAAAAGEGLVPEGLASRAAAWVADAAPRGESAVSLPLYGTFVSWSGVRAVLIGPADRLERMREAVLEFSTLAHELRFIERDLGAALVHVEADSGLAFEFDERAISRRGELAERFRQAVAIRRRLVELAPAIHRPALHPPTLASQIGVSHQKGFSMSAHGPAESGSRFASRRKVSAAGYSRFEPAIGSGRFSPKYNNAPPPRSSSPDIKS